jgi:hypothetical protein
MSELVTAARGEQIGKLKARITVATFHCPSCQHPRSLSERHPAGYCEPCMERGRRYWAERWDMFEIVEVANMLWPEDFLRQELAA